MQDGQPECVPIASAMLCHSWSMAAEELPSLDLMHRLTWRQSHITVLATEEGDEGVICPGHKLNRELMKGSWESSDGGKGWSHSGSARVWVGVKGSSLVPQQCDAVPASSYLSKGSKRPNHNAPFLPLAFSNPQGFDPACSQMVGSQVASTAASNMYRQTHSYDIKVFDFSKCQCNRTRRLVVVVVSVEAGGGGGRRRLCNQPGLR